MKKNTLLLTLAALFVWNVAVSVWLCVATLAAAQHYTNQATHPHAIKAAHKP